MYQEEKVRNSAIELSLDHKIDMVALSILVLVLPS
jgi:hypothetical protein